MCACLHLSSALGRDSLAPHGALEELRSIQSSTNKTTFIEVGFFSWENLCGSPARENSAKWYKNPHGGDQGGKGEREEMD